MLARIVGRRGQVRRDRPGLLEAESAAPAWMTPERLGPEPFGVQSDPPGGSGDRSGGLVSLLEVGPAAAARLRKTLPGTCWGWVSSVTHLSSEPLFSCL